jgi:predicted anti-sigma-YlaC factor YlaD
MTEPQLHHPGELELEAYLDDAMGANEARAIAEHLERCTECAAYVRRLQALNETLRSLPTTAKRIPPLENVIAHRVARRRTREWWISSSPLMAASAAALIFSAGLGTGIAVTRRGSGEPEPPATQVRPALDVQRAGTSYIAALVRLNASAKAGARPVPYGREVALATLYGATAEAVQSLGDDPAGSELLALARAVRERAAESHTRGSVP